MPRPTGVLGEPYRNLQRLASADLGSLETSRQLIDLVSLSLKFLSADCVRVDLISRVDRKKYFSYAKRATPRFLSRPLNESFFESDQDLIARWWEQLRSGQRLDLRTLSRLTYTMAVSYCAAIDLFDRNNKKAPASYFEYFVGHLFAHAIGVNPSKQAAIVVAGRRIRMTMDFLFDPGGNRAHIHLPVKFSTRERVVQAWAHQRILDASQGEGKFRGILVVFSETKLDLQTREVTEICVPDQWLAYQSLLSRMDRIYYFDVPKRYQDLAAEYSIFHLAEFAKFFGEREEVLGRPRQ